MHLAVLRAIVLGMALAGPALPGVTHAQALRLPAGRIDSATLQSTLQMIDYVFVDDRPRAAELFTQLLSREADIDPPMVVQIRYLQATARSSQPAILATYRDLAQLRGGEFVSGMPRVLMAAGEMTEALATARSWKPAPGAAPRPWKEEVESIVARLRGDAPAALAAARAMRRYPGNDRNYFAVGLEIGALALTVRPGTPAAAPLAALLDSALSLVPRGYRVDPVAVFGNYGDALLASGHAALAQKAFTRALAVLDSTAPQAAARGAVGLDSIRLTRGRLLFALGNYAEARKLLAAKSLRRDLREQSRQGWLAVASLRLGDVAEARRLDAALAADTAFALRSATALARASIAEAFGEPKRGAELVLAAKDAIDLRTTMGQWMLHKTMTDPRLVAWMRGR
jgi:tetratricopeptide (TPR) repeat protein